MIESGRSCKGDRTVICIELSTSVIEISSFWSHVKSKLSSHTFDGFVMLNDHSTIDKS